MGKLYLISGDYIDNSNGMDAIVNADNKCNTEHIRHNLPINQILDYAPCYSVLLLTIVLSGP